MLNFRELINILIRGNMVCLFNTKANSNMDGTITLGLPGVRDKVLSLHGDKKLCC